MNRVFSARLVTFVILLVMTGAALLPTLPLWMLLRPAFAIRGPMFEPGGAELLEVLQGTHGGTALVGWTIMLTSALFALSAPVLTMSWLSALSTPKLAWRAFGDGARLYVPSIGVTLCLAPVAFVAICIGVGGSMGAAHFVHEQANARSVAIASLAGLAPGALLFFWVAAAHDLGRAALVNGYSVLRAAGKGLTAAFRPLALLGYGGQLFVSWSLAAAGLVMGHTFDRGGIGWTAMTLLGLELLLVLRIIVRGWWLGACLERTALAAEIELTEEPEVFVAPPPFVAVADSARG